MSLPMYIPTKFLDSFYDHQAIPTYPALSLRHSDWCRSSRHHQLESPSACLAFVPQLPLVLRCWLSLLCYSSGWYTCIFCNVFVQSKVSTPQALVASDASTASRIPVAQLEHLYSVGSWWVRHTSSTDIVWFKWWRSDGRDAQSVLHETINHWRQWNI